MKIERLDIENFRGIRGRLSLDLGPDLTVLYAPNGTGKTSVVDAVEWFSTGEVRRLKELPRRDLRCRVATTRDVSRVQAEFVDLQAERHTISRLLDDSGDDRLHDEARQRTLKDPQLLERIAPTIRGAAGLALNNARKAWLVGTRILELETLRILLDDTDETTVARRNVFHDLLGVGALEKRRESLEKLREPARRQVRSWQKAVEEAERAATVAGNALEAAVAKAAQARADLLGPRAGLLERSGIAADSAPGELQAALRRHVREAQAMQGARDAVAADREALLQRRDRLQSAQALLAEVRGWRDAFDAAKREASRSEATAAQALLARQAALGECREKYDKCSSLAIPDEPVTPEPGPVAVWHDRIIAATRETTEAIGASRAALASLADRRKDLDALRGLARHWGELSAQAMEARAQLAGLPARDTLAARRASLSDELETRRAALGALESVLARLRAAEVESRRLRSAASDCVVCGYVWESPERLHIACDETAARLAGLRAGDVAAVSRLQQALETTERELRNVDHLLQRLPECEDGLRDIESEAAALVARRPAALPALPTVEEAAGQPECLDLPAAALQSATQAEHARLATLTEALAARESDREQAARWRTYAGELARLDPTLPDLAMVGPRDLAEAHRLLRLRLASEVTLAETAVSEAAAGARSLADGVAGLARAAAEAARECAALEIREATVAEVTARLERSWRALAGEETPPTPENVERILTEAERRLEDSEVLQNLAETLAAQADGAAREIGEAQGALVACKARLETSTRALARATHVADRLEVADARLADVRDVALRQTLVPLSQSLTQIYGRLQANRFVDSVAAHPTGRTFAVESRPSAADLALDPREMSQGQRLDLGLAVFLARARSQGGTFFLDEPLVHLDELNRVALIDVFRAVILERGAKDPPLSLVVTTANEQVADLFREKLRFLGRERFQLVRLRGNPLMGVIPAAGGG